MNILKQSFIYKMFVCISNWFDKIFSESFLINLFIREPNNQKRDTNTIFVKLINKIIELLRRIFAKLKLDQIFDNSIFAKPMIWLSITVFLTPFLTTMLCLVMIIITGLSLLLKILILKTLKTWVVSVNF